VNNNVQEFVFIFGTPGFQYSQTGYREGLIHSVQTKPRKNTKTGEFDISVTVHHIYK